ncbi:hypothetical protein [Streptomyces brasiliscabiei]|uniref:hypothetical protein n=1 Tax=Streptomyces brasiliscabiei TaxID=2736302 RepID=UPI001C10E073|nr:hypothetical protein [Streptomyces brasiliscabiei]
MHFTLTYSGQLPSSSNAKVKHEIRRKLHPQLKELWRTHPALVGCKNLITRDSEEEEDSSDAAFLTAIQGNDFAPLVHPYYKLYAELDIFMLRPEAPGAVISKAGDIDNQLKTLFDALRRPTDQSEVPKTWSPAADEAPLYCLLEDDKLITKVSVETDRLLIQGANEKEVQLTIRVSVKGFTATWGNIGMIS